MESEKGRAHLWEKVYVFVKHNSSKETITSKFTQVIYIDQFSSKIKQQYPIFIKWIRKDY